MKLELFDLKISSELLRHAVSVENYTLNFSKLISLGKSNILDLILAIYFFCFHKKVPCIQKLFECFLLKEIYWANIQIYSSNKVGTDLH